METEQQVLNTSQETEVPISNQKQIKSLKSKPGLETIVLAKFQGG